MVRIRQLQFLSNFDELILHLRKLHQDKKELHVVRRALAPNETAESAG
jgi:hypothetical protein